MGISTIQQVGESPIFVATADNGKVMRFDLTKDFLVEDYSSKRDALVIGKRYLCFPDYEPDHFPYILEAQTTAQGCKTGTCRIYDASLKDWVGKLQFPPGSVPLAFLDCCDVIQPNKKILLPIRNSRALLLVK